MNTHTTKRHRCPACRSAEVASASYQRRFHPHGKTVEVTLQTSRCSSCGAEFTSAAQHDGNLAVLKARKPGYEGLLLGEEISALRRRYGITQQQAAKIFGKGKIAFSRYENETSYPDDTTTKLLKLAIKKPDVIRSLADDAGVALPLWDARCEDERGVKLRMISSIGAPDVAAQRWARDDVSAQARHASQAAVPFALPAAHWNAEMVSRSANDDPLRASEAAYA